MSITIPAYITELVVKQLVSKTFDLLTEKLSGSKDHPEESLAYVHPFRIEEENDSVVLFLHGFTGNPIETFENIPELLLSEEEMDGYDVISVAYDSNLIPDFAAGFWAADPDINNVSEYFKTILETRFVNYKRICIVAHSMGGLVAQKTILKLAQEDFNKITHLVLLGTPSGGLKIANNWLARKLKRQIRDLGSENEFIVNLREQWTQKFNDEYPFSFKAVAGLSDEFIPRYSSIDVSNERYRCQTPANHSSMVKADNADDKENQFFILLLRELSPAGAAGRFKDHNSYEINQFLAKTKLVIDELEKVDSNEQSTKGLKKLALAYDALCEEDKSLELLTSHHFSKADTDIMGIIGGRYKRKFLYEGLKESDANNAWIWYEKAFDLSKKENNRTQIYYHAINLAFLSLVVRDSKQDAKKYAQEALNHCDLQTSNTWEIATIAEANLYLENVQESEKYYKLVMTKTKNEIRKRSSIYINARFAYEALNDIEY